MSLVCLVSPEALLFKTFKAQKQHTFSKPTYCTKRLLYEMCNNNFSYLSARLPVHVSQQTLSKSTLRQEPIVRRKLFSWFEVIAGWLILIKTESSTATHHLLAYISHWKRFSVSCFVFKYRKYNKKIFPARDKKKRTWIPNSVTCVLRRGIYGIHKPLLNSAKIRYTRTISCRTGSAILLWVYPLRLVSVCVCFFFSCIVLSVAGSRILYDGVQRWLCSCHSVKKDVEK